MKRFLAHIVIKAKTPLKVGGGKNDLCRRRGGK